MAEKLIEQEEEAELIQGFREQLDAVYLERQLIIAALSRVLPAGTMRTDTEGWDDAWRNVVFIDLPTGQASWHYHDSQAFLFAHLPPYEKPWDGHTTEEKYARLTQFLTPTLPERVVPSMNDDNTRFEIAADILSGHYGKADEAWKEIADVLLLRRAAGAFRDTMRMNWWEQHVRHRASMVGVIISPFESLVEKHGIRKLLDEMRRQSETPVSRIIT